MKKYINLGLILILILVPITAFSASDTTYTGVAFKMIGVPSQGYEIAQTEVTYELWYAVRTWALHNGYSFANAGREGNDGTDGAAPTSANQEPVTNISWRDAMVWCNALNEYYAAKSGTRYQCVYCSDSAYTKPIRTSTDSIVDKTAGTQDNPYINPNAKGFRLPTSDEWYKAARYIDGSAVYPDTYVSGSDAAFEEPIASTDIDGDGDYETIGNVAVYSANSKKTANVKTKSPNKLGLYDMSGNVWEWCFDWYIGGSLRVERGGGWHDIPFDLLVGFVYGDAPSYADSIIGFRPARTN
jgi:formylglycine-generating enzyme required for sulfatase activity